MITYRTYQAGDEESVIHLWNATMPLDPLSQKRFRHLVLLDQNFDPKGMQLAFQKEELVGCVYAVKRLVAMLGSDLETDKGWIPFFFVASEVQRNGVGTELMQRATRFLKESDRKTIYFASYAPHYVLPGLDEKTYPEAYQFLQKNGFIRLYSPVAMDLNLRTFHPSAQIHSLKKTRKLDGYSFSTCRDQDVYPVIQLANTFNPDWGRAIRDGLSQGLPMERILLVKKGHQIVGFCLYGGYEGILERFGPFGVADAEQGKGLGAILFQDCLQQMKQEGLHGAWFLWTSETSAAGNLYKRFGFEVTRRFHVMQLEI